jgi:hypothetical protein
MDRAEIAHNGNSWRALVTAKMTCGFHTLRGILDNMKHVSFSRKSLFHGVNYKVNYIRQYSDFSKSVVSFVIAVRSSGRTV